MAYARKRYNLACELLSDIQSAVQRVDADRLAQLIQFGARREETPGNHRCCAGRSVAGAS